MKLHPRMMLVEHARLDIDEVVLRIQTERGITPIEMARILLTLAELQTTRALRFERHGHYEKKADEA